jgi:hypothetical protein
MTSEQLKIDSGILQYVPKGAYYETSDEQFKAVSQMWGDLFNFDRTLFCLISLLAGTGFSKGAMAHMLLSTPQSETSRALIPLGLPATYEVDVILYNLNKESVPRALRNLLMLTGAEGFPKVNNSRSRRIILEFIFKRDLKSLESLSINFKGKLKTLIRHALGKQTVYNLFNGDTKTQTDLFMKWIGKYNRDSYPIVRHIFDIEHEYKDVQSKYFSLIDQYWKLKFAAADGDVNQFRKLMKGMPQRTILGFRNTYKLPIELSELYDNTKVSDKQAIQSEAAAKRSGAKAFKVNYKNQDLYDLWKAFYYKVMNGDKDNIDEIEEAITIKSDAIQKVNVGECVLVIDASHSMFGSDKRPMHPFLTTLCVVSALDNVKNVFYVGGQVVEAGTKNNTNVLIPSDGTPLWRGLIDAVETGVKNIIVISDGYENEVKGMFQHTYKYFKDSGHDFDLIHINPVFSADASKGTTRQLVSDVKAMPLVDYKYLETELIFKQMVEGRDMVKSLLASKFKQLIQ